MSQEKPELFFGLVGPIGVDLDSVQNALISELSNVGYRSHLIRITELMRDVEVDEEISENSFSEKYNSLIRYADAVCEKAKNRAALAALAVAAIKENRFKITNDEKVPAFGHAYIIRQFKRPAEIDLMRKTYGRKFIQVSISAPSKERKEALIGKIKNFDESITQNEACEKEAIDLIKIDHDEVDHGYGQKISKIYHTGDVFVDGQKPDSAKKTISRFVRALFGDNGVSPSIDEYGMYMAAAASLRSIDLSRQVGASIFSSHGEIIAMGSNEVPKAFGGTYWGDTSDETHRDFDRGSDANYSRKLQLLFDLLDRMGRSGFLSKSLTENRSVKDQLRHIMEDENISDSQVMDIIEFGRMVHAEMSAITDAARLGVSVRNASMYCTTFPCHMCAKHIVSSGIKRLVYLEPYPKSYATELHDDSITFDFQLRDKKVLFDSFIGISPRRYRDIFEKKSRKDAKGKALTWYHGGPRPMIEDLTANYIEENEIAAVAILNPILT